MCWDVDDGGEEDVPDRRDNALRQGALVGKNRLDPRRRVQDGTEVVVVEELLQLGEEGLDEGVELKAADLKPAKPG